MKQKAVDSQKLIYADDNIMNAYKGNERTLISRINCDICIKRKIIVNF